MLELKNYFILNKFFSTGIDVQDLSEKYLLI